MKKLIAWVGLLLLMAVVIAADSVQTEVPSNGTIMVWNGPLPSPDTIRIAPPAGAPGVRIDYLWVSNRAGGTATFADVQIKRYTGYSTTTADSAVDTLVVWKAAVSGGPGAAPVLGQILTAPGGLFTARPGDTLKIITTMASATSLYVACRYGYGRQ